MRVSDPTLNTTSEICCARVCWSRFARFPLRSDHRPRLSMFIRPILFDRGSQLCSIFSEAPVLVKPVDCMKLRLVIPRLIGENTREKKSVASQLMNLFYAEFAHSSGRCGDGEFKSLRFAQLERKLIPLNRVLDRKSTHLDKSSCTSERAQPDPS